MREKTTYHNKYRLVTFYLKPKYMELFEKFEKYIEKDSRIISLRNKPNDGLLSIAIMQLIIKYVDEVENGEVSEMTKTTVNKIENESN